MSRLLGLHPTGQHVLELLGIDLLKQAPKGSFAGHVTLVRVTPARAAAQAATLAMIEALGKLGDRVRSFATGRHCQGDNGQNTRQLVTHSAGMARIGHGLMKTFPKGVQPGGADRTGWRQRPLRIGQLQSQLRRPDLLQGILSQSSHPQLLGMPGVGVKVLPVPRIALGRPQLLPAGGFVAGAPKPLRIDKGFGHPHRIAKVLLPVLGQPLANQLQTPRGQIGPLTRSRQHQKPGVLRDEMPPLFDLARRPAQPLVPQLEVKCR